MKVFGRNNRAVDKRSLIVSVSTPSRTNGSDGVAAVAEGKRGQVADGRLFHARQSSAAAKDLAQQDRFLGGGSIDIRSGIVGPGQPGLNRHHAIGIEPRLHLEQIPETAQQQARGDHEHQRERQFTDDQNLTGARAFLGSCEPRPSCRSVPIKSARLISQAGASAEDGSGRDGDSHRKRQHAPADDFVQVREALGNKPQQECLASRREWQNRPCRRADTAADSR